MEPLEAVEFESQTEEEGLEALRQQAASRSPA